MYLFLEWYCHTWRQKSFVIIYIAAWHLWFVSFVHRRVQKFSLYLILTVIVNVYKYNWFTLYIIPFLICIKENNSQKCKNNPLKNVDNRLVGLVRSVSWLVLKSPSCCKMFRPSKRFFSKCSVHLSYRGRSSSVHKTFLLFIFINCFYCTRKRITALNVSEKLQYLFFYFLQEKYK